MSVRVMNGLAVLFASIACLIAVGGGLAWVAQRPHFSLRAIEVHGDLQHVTSASVRAAVAGRLRGNYFTMRLDEARRVMEGVPWVAQASVRRVWPDRLLVTLVEHRALGVWNDGRLLSDAGELFVANPAEAEIHGPLPAFEGPVSGRARCRAALLRVRGDAGSARHARRGDRRVRPPFVGRRRGGHRRRGDATRARTRHRRHRPE